MQIARVITAADEVVLHRHDNGKITTTARCEGPRVRMIVQYTAFKVPVHYYGAFEAAAGVGDVSVA
jgi:hypothetical protein